MNLSRYLNLLKMDSRLIFILPPKRYPVASNKTRSGREQNRRVTIRLEKEDEEMDMEF